MERAKQWTRAQVALLARRHFGGRARPLEEIVRHASRRHESLWRSTAGGVYRPTESMYALAMRWGLEGRGAVCAVCRGRLEVPEQLPPSGPVGPTLTLSSRVPAREGGLNVPQNLVLCHAGCRTAP